MHIRCPHCHSPIEVVDADPLTDVTCPSCGSNFSLISGETTSYAPGAVRAIAHFQLLESVGAGRFGTVWKARDTKLDRVVAVKIPRRGQIEGPEAEMFVREARAAAQVKHPGVVAVHEVGREDGTLYIVSDFIDGCSLKDWLSGRQLTPREAAELCAKIAEALHVAHEAGVVHRDLKPGNVMMDMAGQPRLTDFGLAKREAGEITMTVDGQMLGTPAYMSPEQARGEAHTADRRSDVYSLGVILFELLTGETPFRGNQRMMVVQILQDDPPSPRKLQTRIPRDLETICLKCLEKPPGKRYQTAAELAAELGRFLRGEPIVARPISRTARLWRWCKRQPVVAGLTAAVALTLVAGTMISSMFAFKAFNEAGRADKKAEEADSNAKRADGKAKEALDEKQKTQRQLALSYIDRGVNELEHGDLWRGFAILGQAYRATDDAPDLRVGVRSLLGAWDHAVPRTLNHQGMVRAVAFSPDGTKIATESGDCTARLWDAATGKPLGGPMGHNKWAGDAVAFSPDGTKIATASYDGTARLWDVATGKPLGEPLRHQGKVYAVAFSPDGTKIATASGEMARLWNVATGKPLGEPLPAIEYVSAVAFSPDGTKIATASDHGMAWIWDVATGRMLGGQLGEAYIDRVNVNAVAFSPEGTKIAIGSDDGTARLWEVATGKPLGEPLRHQGKVYAVAFSPDGTKIATGSDDGTARLWDAATGKPLGEPYKHDQSVQAVVFSPDGTKIATASGHGMAWIWDVATGRMLREPLKYDHFNHRAGAVAFSPDGTKIATGERGDKTVRLRDVATGKPLMHEDDLSAWKTPVHRFMHEDDISALAFSPDGRKIATASGHGMAWIWDVATGRMLGGPLKHGRIVRAVAFSPDGTKIATASYDGTARLWDVATGKPLGGPLKHDHFVLAVAFSPDGTKIATASYDGTARLWNVATGKPLGEPLKHDSGVHAVAFSPDGTKIATGSDDGTARLWDAATGKPRGEPLRNDFPVTAVVFSPDGTKIATLSEDGTPRLWDAATGKPLGEPLKDHTHVRCVAFSPDGTKIATASIDGATRLWDVPRSVPDDRAWIAAYVETVSGLSEDADHSLHPLSNDEAVSDWREVLKSPGWLEQRTAALDRSRYALHVTEADEREAAKNWFAAAFHLRWLCKMETKNPEWKERLAKAAKHLAEAGKEKAKQDKPPVDSSKAQPDRKETVKK